ncbi:protein phosphatase CheZ [Methylobacillus flagellatus]|uniref:protein phosphatase CheZ n=1 Tax=Methylobacillus flagellatus TaxID=405 RepID=UPI0010F61855|nr:protein phosphatase CheZ [Methylobacillus flagellatus]
MEQALSANTQDALRPMHGMESQDEMLNRIGQLTRNLHDSLRGLGIDGLLEKAAQEIPDARDRLEYVARMTEQAAQRVLNATDVAMPMQDDITKGAQNLHSKWQLLLDAPGFKREYDALARDTQAYLLATQQQAEETRQLLMDIMMAQDFQDLTGQVIKRVTEIAHNMEQQLLQLLLDYKPSHAVGMNVANSVIASGVIANADAANARLMNGPQIDPAASPDVVQGQAQVDDLLEQLGF